MPIRLSFKPRPSRALPPERPFRPHRTRIKPRRLPGRGQPGLPPVYEPLPGKPGGGLGAGAAGLIGGILLPMVPGWQYIDYIDHWKFYKDPNPFKIEGGGWYPAPAGDSGRRPGSPPYEALPSIANTGPAWGTYAGHIVNFLAGQAASLYTRWPDPYVPVFVPVVGSSNRSLVLADTTRFPGQTSRARHDYWWWRDSSWTDLDFTMNRKPVMGRLRMPGIGDGIDPNVLGGLPGNPPYGQPLTPSSSPDPWGQPVHGEFFPPGTNPRPAPRHRRKPPGPGTKEHKVRGNLARLFELLDIVSEWSELVDALYESLPADVRARWGRGRDGRGLIDSAGQYGIDGADWKAQALYYNWSKIDPEMAFKNIVANEVQDKLYGSLHRVLPNNVGQAVDPSMKEFNKMVEELNAAFGLTSKW